MSNLPNSIRQRLQNRAYREAFVAEGVRNWVALQIRRLREARGMSQAEFGQFIGKPQSVVSRLEDPDYGRLSVSTLLDVAAALDIALLVQFVDHEQFLLRTGDLTSTAMFVPSFDHLSRIGRSNTRTSGSGRIEAPVQGAAASGDASRTTGTLTTFELVQ